MDRRWPLLLALAAVVLAAPVAAQDRPVVFVHGLNANPGTWQATADRLRNQLEITTYVPAVPWAAGFETQAGSLQQQLGNLPSSTVAIGHSNGGIASREWSRHRALSGVMTVGSPQSGAPLVNNIFALLGFHEALYYSAAGVFAALGVQPNEWWDVYLYVEIALALAQGYSVETFSRVAGLGLLQNYPVLSQMAVGSGYLLGLNSPGNLGREASAIPARVGLVYELDRYWQLGPWRAFDPPGADVWYPRLWGSIATLEFAGSYLMMNYPTSSRALTIANQLFAVAAHLRAIDPMWCWATTGDGSCATPHDGIVPIWSQIYPGGRNLYIHGPSHVQETHVSDTAIAYGLTSSMDVRPRGSGGGGPGPGGPGPGGPGPGGASDEMHAGESLYAGDSRTSSNGEYSLHYQGDGNLVLYRNSDGSPVWNTGTFGNPGEAAMQGDGNFVVYNAAGQPVWSSGTVSHPGAWLAVQSDGNLVLYDPYGYPIWWR